MSKIPDETIVAWDIDLDITNSSLCRTTLPAGATSPTRAGGRVAASAYSSREFTNTLLPSVMATYQGHEGIGEAAQGNVVITVPASFQAAQLR